MCDQTAVIVKVDDFCSEIANPENVIKEITGKKEGDLSFEDRDGLLCVPWSIENKYYTADVGLCLVKTKDIISESFASSVQATVAIFNSRKDCNGIAGLSSWLSYFDVWNPDIKLAVCERCASDSSDPTWVDRESILHWCLEHDFELVELDPILEDYDEYEEFGFKRIRNALNAHTWPEMTMVPIKSKVSKPPTKDEKVDREAEKIIDGLLSDPTQADTNNEDDFESLFQKMHLLKEKADSLPQESRKEYAEKVVMAFWKALDGNEQEIEGLSSDED